MALPELLEFPVGNYTSGSVIVDEGLSKRVTCCLLEITYNVIAQIYIKLLDFECCTVVIRSSEFIILSLHSSA